MTNQAQRKQAAVIFLTLMTVGSAANSSFAAPPARAAQPTAQAQQQQQLAPPTNEATIRPVTSDNDEAGTLPERIDVQSMKRRYWTVGNEDLMDVVQNRLYTKRGRMEVALRYGFWSDDPFLSQNTIGLSLGYHFNEFFSLHGFYASISNSPSQAYDAAKAATAVYTGGAGVDPITNPEKSVYGVEGRASLLYGKLSLLGHSIVYYDFNIAAGLSQNKATVGSSTGYFVGLGQQFYLNKNLFLTVDYRMLFHTDKFNAPPKTDRALTTNWIQVGIGSFFP